MIKDRVIETKKISWKNCKWFQSDLKSVTDKDFNSLKNIILKHGIIRAFKVWQDKETIWLLDGHLLQRVLEDIGKEVPDKLSAEFIECDNKKQAAEFVLFYSSFYHKIAEQGLFDFQQKFKLDLPKLDIDLPGIDFEGFKVGFLGFNLIEDPREKEIDENIETDFECPKCHYRWS